MRRIGLVPAVFCALGVFPSLHYGSPDDVVHRMQLPGKSWGVSVAIPGFKIEEQWTREDASGMMISGANGETGVVLSLYLERESKNRSSAWCRTEYFSKALGSPARKSMVKKWEAEALALGQYMIASVGDVKLRQMHVNAYLGKEDVCMDLHLSKASFEAADRALFDAILSTVHVFDGSEEETAGEGGNL